MSEIVLGVDPGWQSFGVAITIDGKLEYAKNFIPANSKTPHEFISNVFVPDVTGAIGASGLKGIEHLYIERFVAYAGIHSNASEDILMNIGAFCYAIKQLTYQCEVNLVRAIDWKQNLCKYLVRSKQFSNPYPSFDKKYSILAAQTVSGRSDISTNHEADAICLSYLREVDVYESNRRAVQSKAR